MSQISYISIKDIIKENRMDAEFHRNIFVNPKLNYDYIWNLLKKNTQYWISIDMNLEWKWYKIYRMNEIENMFCNTEVEKYADIEEKEMKKFKMNDRDVLFNRTNSYEFVWRTWLFRKYSDEDLVFASYLVRVNPDENKILPEYLTTFLNTKYWIFDVKRRAKISINQSNVSAEELKKVRIPVLDMEIQEKIKDLFDKAFLSSQKSKQLYQEAEDLLLTELWLKSHTISHTLTFSTTKKAVDEAWRYDADYFQPKYDELIEKIENYKWGWDLLKNLTTYINNWNQPPYSDNWDIRFFSQKWIKDKWIDYSFLESTEEPMVESSFFEEEKNKSSLVTKWDILYYSVWANLWYCHTYLWDENIAVWSFINIIRTDKSKFDCVALWIILNSMVWRMQADRDKSWVAQPYIYAKNLRKFKIPLINSQLQKEISDKIKESFKLRNESKELLEQAKTMVEDEIEKE